VTKWCGFFKETKYNKKSYLAGLDLMAARLRV